MPAHTAEYIAEKKAQGHGMSVLPDYVAHAQTGLWQTPVADDAVNREKGKFNSRGEPKLSGQAIAAMWPTPEASDGSGGRVSKEVGGTRPSGAKRSITLATVAHHAMWPTPTAVDGNRGLTTRPQDTGKLLPQRVGEVLGIQPAGSSATTEKPGALAPGFVSWLMGFPPEWLDCAPDAMPKKPRKSK